MKDLKDFILESVATFNLDLEEDPESQIGDYCGGVPLPNIPDLIKRLEIKDFINKGTKWVIVSNDMFEVEALENADNLDIPIIPYSYGPGQEQTHTYSEYKDMWDNASNEDKKKTIDKLLGKIDIYD